MLFQTIPSETDAKALDLLLIAFLLLFTLAMFMQFGIPNIHNALGNTQISHTSVLGY